MGRDTETAAGIVARTGGGSALDQAVLALA